MKVKFNGGIKDVPLSEVTPANYICPQREERFWHVIQEKKEFDSNTGKRLSRPVLQKYDNKCYAQTKKYLTDAGYTLTVVHDPIEWMRQQNEARANAQRIAAERKAQADKAAKAAEREALKAELRKEMEAEREKMRKELLSELKKEQKKENNKK